MKATKRFILTLAALLGMTGAWAQDAARKQTDEAIRRAYDILNALAVLQPTQELTQLVTVLFGIEDRAKLYYISRGKTGGDRPTPTPTPSGGDGSEEG